MTDITSLPNVAAPVQDLFPRKDALFQQKPQEQSVTFRAESSVEVELRLYRSVTQTPDNSSVEDSVVSTAQQPSLSAFDLSDVAETILQRVTQELSALRQQNASSKEQIKAIEAAKLGVKQGIKEAVEVLADVDLLTEDVEKNLRQLEDKLERSFSIIVDKITAALSESKPLAPVKNEKRLPDSMNISSALDVTNRENKQIKQEDKKLVNAVRGQAIQEDLPMTSALSERRSSFVKSLNSYRASLNQAQTYRLQLRTVDGDSIELRFDRMLDVNLAATDNYSRRGSFSLSQGAFESATFLDVSILGQLDEDELASIESLLTQLNKVATTFIERGDAAALTAALNLEINTEEIAAFTFDMQLRESIQASQQYRSIDAMGKSSSLTSNSNSNISLASFVEQLLVAVDSVLQDDGRPPFLELPTIDQLLAALLVVQSSNPQADPQKSKPSTVE